MKIPKSNGSIYHCVNMDDIENWALRFADKEPTLQIRLDLSTAGEFESLLKKIQSIAKVNFLFKPIRMNPKKFAWRKKFVCHHGGRSKVKKYWVSTTQKKYSNLAIV